MAQFTIVGNIILRGLNDFERVGQESRRTAQTLRRNLTEEFGRLDKNAKTFADNIDKGLANTNKNIQTAQGRLRRYANTYERSIRRQIEGNKELASESLNRKRNQIWTEANKNIDAYNDKIQKAKNNLKEFNEVARRNAQTARSNLTRQALNNRLINVSQQMGIDTSNNRKLISDGVDLLRNQGINPSTRRVQFRGRMPDGTTGRPGDKGTYYGIGGMNDPQMRFRDKEQAKNFLKNVREEYKRSNADIVKQPTAWNKMTNSVNRYNQSLRDTSNSLKDFYKTQKRGVRESASNFVKQLHIDRSRNRELIKQGVEYARANEVNLQRARVVFKRRNIGGYAGRPGDPGTYFHLNTMRNRDMRFATRSRAERFLQNVRKEDARQRAGLPEETAWTKANARAQRYLATLRRIKATAAQAAMRTGIDAIPSPTRAEQGLFSMPSTLKRTMDDEMARLRRYKDTLSPHTYKQAMRDIEERHAPPKSKMAQRMEKLKQRASFSMPTQLMGEREKELSRLSKYRDTLGPGTYRQAIDSINDRYNTRNRLNRALERSQSVVNNLKNALQNYNRMGRKTTSINEQIAKSAKEADKENRRQGVSFTSMLGLMVKFGVAMELIMLPGRLIGALGNILSSGAKWEEQIANIHSLISDTDSGMVDLGRTISDIAVQTGAAGDIFEAGYEAASSLNTRLINEAATLTKYGRDMSAEQKATAALVEIAAKDAVAGATELQTTMEAVVRMQSGFNLSIAETEEASNSVFNLIRDGVVNYDKIAHHIGSIIGGINRVWGSGDQKRSLQHFREINAAIATITRTIPPDETFTSMRNFLRDILNMPTEGKQLTQALRYHVDAEGRPDPLAYLTREDIIAQGPDKTFRELHKVLDPYGRVIDTLVANHQKLGIVMGDEATYRQSLSTKLNEMMFDNIRTVKGVSALVHSMELYNDTLERQNNLMNSRDIALERNKDTLQNVLNSTKSLFNRFKSELFWNVRNPISEFFKGLNKDLSEVLNSRQFENATFALKLEIAFDTVMHHIQKWLDSGGKGQMMRLGEAIGSIISKLLNTLVANSEFQSALGKVGAMIGAGIVKGIGAYFLEQRQNIGKYILQGFFPNAPAVTHSDYKRLNLSKELLHKGLTDQERIQKEQQYMALGGSRKTLEQDHLTFRERENNNLFSKIGSVFSHIFGRGQTQQQEATPNLLWMSGRSGDRLGAIKNAAKIYEESHSDTEHLPAYFTDKDYSTQKQDARRRGILSTEEIVPAKPTYGDMYSVPEEMKNKSWRDVNVDPFPPGAYQDRIKGIMDIFRRMDTERVIEPRDTGPTSLLRPAAGGGQTSVFIDRIEVQDGDELLDKMAQSLDEAGISHDIPSQVIHSVGATS